jgi:feruloyl esterase
MGAADDFYRLYLVPGMLHCGGGPGPGTVDWLKVLDSWVGEKAAPGQLVATGSGGASQALCPYPGVARKQGESWSCKAAARAR